MNERHIRTVSLIGEAAFDKLKSSHIAVIGIGGVGSYTAEALCRCGVGKLTIIDNDTVSVSNINRQLPALISTVGRKKVEVMKERMTDINPDAQIIAMDFFLDESNIPDICWYDFDYVIDCIDSVKSKLAIIKICKEREIPIISSMGTGNKLDPSKFEICDITKTSVCPLARVMRRELKNIGIPHHTVLYSKEEPVHISLDENGRHAPASISFVPSVAGLMLAGYAVNDLIKNV